MVKYSYMSETFRRRNKAAMPEINSWWGSSPESG